MGKKITISICTYDNYALLVDSMQRLANQSVPPTEYDVLILDNSPPDVLVGCEFAESFAAKHKNFTYVKKQTDGLSGARNECIKLTTTDLIHFIDDDAFAEFNFVESTLDCFTRHTKLSVMGGKVVPNWSLTKRPPWLSDDALGYLSMLDFGNEEIMFGDEDGMWLVGANICFKVDVLKKYGGFSNKLGRKGWSRSLMGAEEMKLIYEMKDSEDIIYSPNVVVSHVVPRDRMNQSWFIKRVAWQSVSDVMTDTFYLEHPGSWSDGKHGYDFIRDEIETLFSETDSSEMFSRKLKVVKMLSFWMLNDFKKNG